MVEPLVIPFVVVVRDELAAGATPRALADQDHALEAGDLDGAHDALRVGVQGRRAGGATEGGDIGRGEPVGGEFVGIRHRSIFGSREPGVPRDVVAMA